MKSNDEYLVHHGIKGMKWGVRRFRNKDGSLTSAGKKRYDGDSVSDGKKSKWKKGRKVAAIAGGTAAAAGVAAGGVALAKSLKKGKLSNPDIWKQNRKQGKDKPNISPAEDVAKKGDRIVQESTKVGGKIVDMAKSRHARKNFKDNAKGKSDDQLRREINRIRLEREYNSLTNEDTSRGYETAKTVLEVVGSVSTIALSAVGIYGTIKSIKSKAGV